VGIEAFHFGEFPDRSQCLLERGFLVIYNAGAPLELIDG
jgi:hypothetical protein